MATRLYFHEATSALSNLPTAEQSSLTTTANVDAQTVNRTMTRTIGTTQTSKSVTHASATARTQYFTRFVSDPLDAAQASIAANTWTYSFAARESGTAANFPVASTNQAVRVTCYVWRPGTGKLGNILDGTSAATPDEGAASVERGSTCTFAGSAVASTQAGDVICFEVIIVYTPSSLSLTCDYFYDGTTVTTTDGTVSSHASFIETPEDIRFSGELFNLVRTASDTVTVSESVLGYKPGPAQVKFGTITMDATSGAHTQTFTSELGFRPKGMIFWSTGQTATGTAAKANFSVGMSADKATGEMGFMTNFPDNDTLSSNLTNQNSTPNSCLDVYDGTTQLLLASPNFQANGFDLVYSVKTNTVQYKWNYFAFTAPNIANVNVVTVTPATGAGDQDITTVGFTGSIAFFGGGDYNNNTNTGANSCGIGVAMSDTKQWASCFAADNVSTTNTVRRQRTDRCFLAVDTSAAFPAIAHEASFVQWLSNGLRINWAASVAGDSMQLMVVQGGDWDLGAFNQPTSNGNQIVDLENEAFNVGGVLFTSFGNVSNTGSIDHSRWMLGGGDGTTEACSAIGITDAVTTSIAKKDHSETKSIRLLTETSGGFTTNAEADLTDVSVAGEYTLNWPTTDATAREVCWVACGDTFSIVTGTNYTRTATDTETIADAALTRIKSAARIPSADSRTVTDSSLTRILSSTRVPGTDTVTIADSSLVRVPTWTRLPSTETTTIADSSLVRLLSSARVSSDTTTVSGETLLRNTQAFRIPSSDTTTVVDATLTRSKAIPRLPSTDSTTVVDSSLSRLLSAARNPGADTITVTAGTSTRMLSALRIPSTDTITSTENLAGGKVYGRIPATDTVTIADSALTRLLSVIRTGSDTTIVGENLIRILSAFRTTAPDNVTVADAGVPIRIRSLTRLTPADDTTVTDSSLTRMLQALRVPTAETTTSNENITATASGTVVRTVSDTIAATDGTLTRILSAIRVLSPETVVSADSSLTRMKSALRIPTQDTVTVTDSSLARMLQLVRIVSTDTITLNENVTRELTTAGAFSRTALDTVIIADASLFRLLQSRRTGSDTTAVSENVLRSILRVRSPTADTITVGAGTVTRLRSVVRLPTQDTANIIEASLIRLLSLARAASDITVVAEVQNAIAHSRALSETISVTEPLLQRVVSAARSVSDIVDITEQVFFQTWHRFVFDNVVVAEQLFSIRESLTGAVTYATPDEVRPLLGNLGSQRTDAQINLAIDAAYDEINTKTNRIPPNDWKDTDHNFGVVKKLTRYIAAKEMAIGIKDFDTKPLEMEIERLFEILLTYDTSSDATADIVGSSPDVTYALNQGGIIWSTRYPNLTKGSSSENDTTINPNT